MDKATLERFVQGQLSHSEAEMVMNHLAEDEASLDYVDQLWQQQTLIPAGSEPKLTSQTAKDMEKRVVKRIHRANLGVTLFWLSTQGMVDVFVALTKPLVQRNSHPKRRRR